MYASNDPRSTLGGQAKATATPTAFAAADYARFYETPPQEEGPGGRVWYARGQAFLVSYADALPGLELVRAGQTDEYMLLMPDDNCAVTVTAGGESREVAGRSLVILPPGDSRVVATSQCRLVRLFSTQSADLNVKCLNRDAYAGDHPNVAAWQPWPEPVGGYKLRVYSLNVPKQEGRFGCLFRCTTLMVNVFDVSPPRDITKLSPHHHDDFEQGSLAMKGVYMHHIRWPWTSDMKAWRADDHEVCATPSVAIIPPPAIHTSRGIDPNGNQLIDIFAPPRFDFSAKPGWVLNADEYPMPSAG
jgi:hypothetical protein